MQDRTAFTQPPSDKLGKYEVLDVLGRGSMGMVFLARDPLLERNVAIKVMVGASVHDQKMRERFEREAKAVARLQHPNIVTVYDLGYDRHGSPFIAMELLEGTSLAEIVETDPPTLGRKLEIVVEVCRGLEHAHRHGIVHRDIKPANVFVARDGGTKIMDFGVARYVQSSQTQGGIVVGTAGYMSPEQLRGKTVDGRSDLFSLGVCLFEVLTNQVLFSGDGIEAVFFQTLNKPTPALTLPDGTKIPQLQEILNRALAKDVDKRYSSAGEIAEAIRGFLRTHEPILDEEAFLLAREPDDQERKGEPRGKAPPFAFDRGCRSGQPTQRPDATVPPRASRPVGARMPVRVSTGSGRRAMRANRLPWVLAAAILLTVGIGARLFVWRPPGRSDSGPAATPPQSNTSPEIPAPEAPVPPAEPTPREQAAILAADAAIALGSSKLEEAESLIVRGEDLDHQNPRWVQLRHQLRSQQVEAERKTRAADHVRVGKGFLEAGDFQNAVDSYQKALEYDSENRQARIELDRALSLERKAGHGREPPSAVPRPFAESETEFTPSAISSEKLLGFEEEEGFEVKETVDPFFPAQLSIEFHPSNARAGEPYVLRVSVFNEGYRAIELDSLELVSRFGGKATGKGQPIPIRVRQVGPQGTAILHEVAGKWNESQNHGEMEATVSLADGGQLKKTIRW